MHSYFRLLFAGVVMLFFLGALDDQPDRSSSAEPVKASPVHSPESLAGC